MINPSAPTTLITFVIPTRNRQECLRSMLQTFARFYREKCKNFEVVVLDNSDDDSLSCDATKFPFPLIYIYEPNQLSVVENFNIGTNHLRGTFTCFMGDDDLISARIFDLAELMVRHDIDAAVVAPETRGVYFWPGVFDMRWGDVGGTLFLGDATGSVNPVIVSDAIEECRSHVCDGPQRLPRVYSGLIAKRCIDRVIKRHGPLFGGCSPDIYSSRLLASVVERLVTVDLPFLLAGASKTSTSAQRAERSDVGKLKDNDHLGRFKNLDWDPRIPEFYSPFTVWGQSYLQAEQKLGRDFNNSALAYIYAKCLIFARGNSKTIFKSMLRSRTPVRLALWTSLNLIITPARYFAQKLPLLINHRPGGCKYALTGLKTSNDAARRLDEMIRDIPFSLDLSKY